ncbi:hypothetical protein AB0J74_17600 [Asanoa sp. NPDC049573]
MPAVPVVIELPARPQDPEPQAGEITVVDMEEFSAANKCSCAASDDNPY